MTYWLVLDMVLAALLLEAQAVTPMIQHRLQASFTSTNREARRPSPRRVGWPTVGPPWKRPVVEKRGSWEAYEPSPRLRLRLRLQAKWHPECLLLSSSILLMDLFKIATMSRRFWTNEMDARILSIAAFRGFRRQSNRLGLIQLHLETQMPPN